MPLCPDCQLTGIEAELRKAEIPGSPDPKTGDVWTIPVYVCPSCPYVGEYDPEDDIIEMDDDS